MQLYAMYMYFHRVKARYADANCLNVCLKDTLEAYDGPIFTY